MSNKLTTLPFDGNVGLAVAQLTHMAGYLPDAKRGPFLGRLRSFSSIGATQRQSMVDYLLEALSASGLMAEAQAAWDRSQAEGLRFPAVDQTASLVRTKLAQASQAIRAANKLNKLNSLIAALAQLASIADVNSIDELALMPADQLTNLASQLSNADYSIIAPYLSLPKRG